MQVELVSANPTGPITVASARNGAYGDAVARLLAFAGHEVEREYYYNDAGAQMDRFRESVEAARRGEEPPEDGYHGAYVAELAREEGDPVPRMLAQIEAALERFRIHFDTFERQSEVEAEVPEAIGLLDTYEADGAVWAQNERARRRQGSRRRPLERRADVLRVRRRLHPSQVRAGLRPARSTCSAPTTTGTSRASRRSPRCSATRGSPSRCSSTSSST